MPACFLARPKSRILICCFPRRASTTNRLAGLISRWMMPLAWAAARAAAACWAKATTSSARRPFPPALPDTASASRPAAAPSPGRGGHPAPRCRKSRRRWDGSASRPSALRAESARGRHGCRNEAWLAQACRGGAGVTAIRCPHPQPDSYRKPASARPRAPAACPGRDTPRPCRRRQSSPADGTGQTVFLLRSPSVPAVYQCCPVNDLPFVVGG